MGSFTGRISSWLEERVQRIHSNYLPTTVLYCTNGQICSNLFLQNSPFANISGWLFTHVPKSQKMGWDDYLVHFYDDNILHRT